MQRSASVHTIPIQKSFLDVLAHGLLAEFGTQPEMLPRLLVLLPNRRSCRSLREAFLRASTAPLLLPRMRPIGDVEEDELFLLALEQGGEIAERIAQVAPPMTGTRRLMLLAHSIWSEEGPKGRTANQSFALAEELVRFLDEVTREGISASNLARLVPEEYARHWQITMTFLSRLFDRWPQTVASEQRLEPVERRNRLLHALADYWQRQPSPYPVIAAGSTGSIPATAKLLKVISRMPKGRVILPGLDLEASNDVWDHVGPSHPQFGLKQLLERMECERREVRIYDSPAVKATGAARVALMHEAMRPAEATDLWRQLKIDPKEGLKDIALHVCRNSIEEAKLIAVALREALETPGKTAALITHDRGLAVQVAAQMQRYQIVLDDSAGQPITRTPPGSFFQLLANAVHQRFAPVAMLSLLKHPLAACGLPTESCRHAARLLERRVLRGLRPAPGLRGIRDVLEKDGEEIPPELDAMLANLEKAVARYAALVQSDDPVSLSDLLFAHIAACEAVATTDEIPGIERLWDNDPGAFLNDILEEALEAAPAWPAIEPDSYPELMQALLLPKTWRPTYGQHPRLHVLSPLEARLQHYDRVILGGMNEESWPPAPGVDPWMSRPMRETFGLPSPERQIGQAAHDFLMLMGAPEVILTRAERSGNAPAVPSRWLVRLAALIDGIREGQSAELPKHIHYRHWLAAMEAADTYVPANPPAPTPPVEARPRRLSVTDVETLLRDPYGIYARHVLGLRKLDPIDKEPDAAQFGQVFHAALEDFSLRFPETLPEEIEAELQKSGEHAFRPLSAFPAVRSYWMPRYRRICEWLAEQEKARRGSIQKLLSEQKGEWQWQAPRGTFTLTARIDRIEIREDGNASLIDYKTGSVPERYEIEEGYACQLPLSGIMMEKGNVSNLQSPVSVVEMAYWKLGGVEEAGSIKPLTKSDAGAIRNLMVRAEEGVQELIARYDDRPYPYHSLPQAEYAPRYSDYLHLARVKEWGAD